MDPVIEMVAQEYAAFTLGSWDEQTEESGEEQCIFGKQYEAFARDLCQTVLKNPSHIAVNEGYLELFKKYMEWRIAVPKNHRNRIGRGHRCIFHVLESGYQQLRRLELMLPTPKLYLPPVVMPPEPKPLPPPPLFPDVFIPEPE
jgi:hypothetical protein